MIFFIRFYQLTLGILLGGACRFQPSCSEYAVEAYKRYAFVDATCLVIKRILRCQPFGSAGYDPVPTDRAQKGCSRFCVEHGSGKVKNG